MSVVFWRQSQVSKLELLCCQDSGILLQEASLVQALVGMDAWVAAWEEVNTQVDMRDTILNTKGKPKIFRF